MTGSSVGQPPPIGTRNPRGSREEIELPHDICTNDDAYIILDHEREVQLRHSHKLEAVGRLAAGIAHEINTPLQFVGDTLSFLEEGFAALIDRLGPPDTEEQAYLVDGIPPALARAQRGLARVSEIVRAIKDFAYPDRFEKLPADLNKAIADTLTVASSEFKYTADIETDFGDLAPVHCHVGDINQVFLNFLTNAAHAIKQVAPEGTRGKIAIRTRQVDDFVTITISDTGCGIPPSIRDKIFDPFFTTKEVGEGTGQGLAIARNIIVARHGGTIDFTSAPGVGTSFVIRLPLGGPERLVQGG